MGIETKGLKAILIPKVYRVKSVLPQFNLFSTWGTFSEYWENCHIDKYNWDYSNPIDFVIHNADNNSAKCTQLVGHWEFMPQGLSQHPDFDPTTKIVCFNVTVTCDTCSSISSNKPSDIFPTSTPTPRK